MRLRDTVLGALGLFGTSPGRLDADDLALAQALVHVACVAIVNEQASADDDVISSQLQHALDSRILLEQAKGVVAYDGKVDMSDAFIALRGYAHDHGTKLSEVARAVVQRELRGHVVIDHSRSTAIQPQ